ncbi:MAG TPA: D-alanyl-D-alanine carboxypeptidase family protein [Pyrinomonadaceae bacterium]|nr:D-alanyl-D-alanine carboxypeptidase family protein [Pyrinomonadaceae bacterium]
MKNVVIIFLLVFVAGVVAYAARSGQSKSKSAQPMKPTPAVRVTETSAPKASAFTAATAENASLRNDLTWTFGGKQQRGWYLYDLLIGETLNVKSDPITTTFAESLAAWKKKRGLTANGVLDEDTLMALVSQWQSDRLKNRAYATPDQLLTAPPADFFDPSRADELRQVEKSTYAAYKKMVAAASADPSLKLGGQYLKIVSAFRSREYQDNLRRQSPNAGSAGLAVNSPHFTGRALDLYVGGSPVDTKDSNRAIQVNTPVYRWLVRNAERFGFRPYFYEPWHWEYVK